jgi:hypothetical protein
VEATVSLADDLEVGAYGRVIALDQCAFPPFRLEGAAFIFSRADCVARTLVTVKRRFPERAEGMLPPPLRSRDHRTNRSPHGQTCADASDQPFASTLALSHSLHYM